MARAIGRAAGHLAAGTCTWPRPLYPVHNSAGQTAMKTHLACRSSFLVPNMHAGPRHFTACFSTQATASPQASPQTPPQATLSSSIKGNVVVLGAGVIGLTSALRLLQAGASVTVVAMSMGWETTTAGAAGLWGPYKLGDTLSEFVDRWSSDTLIHLYDLLHSADAEDAGISLRLVHRYQEDGTPNPSWMNVVDHFTFLTDTQLNRVNRQLRLRRPFTLGWQYHSISCEGGPYLRWLHKQISDLGGQVFLTPDPVTSLSQLSEEAFWARCSHVSIPDKGALGAPTNHGLGVMCMGQKVLGSLKGYTLAQYLNMDIKQQEGVQGEGLPKQSRTATATGTGSGSGPDKVDLIVNCTGLGASKLLADNNVMPIRGQVLRVAAPWVTSAYLLADSLYVIPNNHSIVLGGTAQYGNWNTEPSVEDRQRIVAGCVDMLPSLSTAVILQDWVGLRPGRTSVRLALDDDQKQGGGSRGNKPHVIHNYGHGGSGLTLAWGCAGDVVDMAKEVL